ncbi:MAG TPA: DUF3306 domain-containing protein [Burkholderiales bacterium]|nr:DUF3306 domain-containing protein [Burkholderiales bacterium]
MSEDKEAFLSRWSRLKRDQKVEKVEKPPETPAPALPSVETLTPESDFSGFMHPKVKEELRRLALKKLFNDPHFNIPDPFEPYSRDFNIAEAIPPEMLAQLNQARTVLFREEEEKKQKDNEPKAGGEAPAASQEGNPQDEPGRKDA